MITTKPRTTPVRVTRACGWPLDPLKLGPDVYQELYYARAVLVCLGVVAAVAAWLEPVLAACGELLLRLLLCLDLLLGEMVFLVAEVGLLEDELAGLALVLGRCARGELGIYGRRLRRRVLPRRRGGVATLLSEPARPALRLALLRLLAVTGQGG